MMKKEIAIRQGGGPGAFSQKVSQSNGSFIRVFSRMSSCSFNL